MRRAVGLLALWCTLCARSIAAQPPAPPPKPISSRPSASIWVVRPARVFEVETGRMHTGWAVRVDGDRITASGPTAVEGDPIADPKALKQVLLLMQGGVVVRRD